MLVHLRFVVLDQLEDPGAAGAGQGLRVLLDDPGHRGREQQGLPLVAGRQVLEDLLDGGPKALVQQPVHFVEDEVLCEAELLRHAYNNNNNNNTSSSTTITNTTAAAAVAATTTATTTAPPPPPTQQQQQQQQRQQQQQEQQQQQQQQ